MTDSDRAADRQPPVETRPTEPQRRYLERGLTEPGGKLPLFDRDGRQVPRKTIDACLPHGWAEPWTANPIKPDWLVYKLASAGYRVLGVAPQGRGTGRNKSKR
jgi:hypothetical protein